MKLVSIRSRSAQILVFVAAALFSTMALAISLTWQFDGQANDGSPFSARMTFDSTQSPSATITGTLLIDDIEDIEVPVLTEFYTFSGLSFGLGDLTGSTMAGTIIQTDVLGNLPYSDTYSIQGKFAAPPGSGAISATLTMDFAGFNLFNSLLTDIDVLRTTLPGTFTLSAEPFTTTTPIGTIESVSDLTAIPEPWTLGLLLSGLGSMGFLSFAALRSRRSLR